MSRRDLVFRVFVSSTFSDLAAERNALQADVFPAIRKYCQERNARFQAIDLRWGVGEEAALDQQTMNICVRELRRCQELSPRPNFIVLLGDRYGWRPLPPQVEAEEFESLLAKVAHDEKDSVLRWYRRDDNAVPPEYVLQPRTGEFVEYNCWAREEASLRAILLKAVEQVLPADDPRRAKWFDSATHQEIRHGAFVADSPQDHVFCYFRHIDGLPVDRSASTFSDVRPDGTPDADAERRLSQLKRDLKELLPEEHVHEYSVDWQAGRPQLDKVALKDLCEAVERNLKAVIDREVASFRQREELDRERESHQEFAADRSRHFVGRADILRCVKDYLVSDENKPLILHGRSGSGKTAVMAKAWLDLSGRGSDSPRDTAPAEPVIVARFIGATPGSCDLRSLLAGLCRELGVDSVPSDMNELVQTFRDRLSPPGASENKGTPRPPAVLFLDALDQLNPADNAWMLYWLPRELAPSVKLVMSVLETDKPADPLPPEEYDCFDLAGRIWPSRLVSLGGLDERSGETLLGKWLDESKRTLQPTQREHLLARFAACPLPLYLKLAVEEARRWRSWEGLPGIGGKAGLRESIEGVLDDLFDRLAQPRNHGPTLVSRALGYIAAGRNGLTEDELLDVLSADKDVMEWFYDQSPTEKAKAPADRIKSLPVVIWLRLFADIERYMTRRRADGAIVMDFYHRQVRETIERRYLAGDDRVRTHQALADYFHKLDYWAESLEAQRARVRRLPPTPRPANVRKVVELPYHRLKVAKLAGKDDPKSPYWDAVADLLLDWQFMEAKAEADPNFREQETTDPSVSPAGEAKP